MKSLLFFILFLLCFYPSITLKGQENKTDNVSLRGNMEAHLDSIWRKENIWNLGVAKITGEPLSEMTCLLNEQGFVTSKGCKFQITQVKRLLVRAGLMS
jgi:hypothetical protein